MKNKFKDFIHLMKEKHPNIPEKLMDNNRSLISNLDIKLPNSIKHQVESFISIVFKMSRKEKYKESLRVNDHESTILENDHIKNFSVLMAYDFHIKEDQAKLIEINTNASGYLIANQLGQISGQACKESALWESFKEEANLFPNQIQSISIIDENPKDQNMYCEFLMYKDLFEREGLNCNILDISDVSSTKGNIYFKDEKINYIYNRYCDFTFSDTASKKFLDSYLEGSCLYSPNPKEYILLSDKNRLTEWSLKSWQEKAHLSPEEKSILDRTLPATHLIQSFEKQDLWEKRKTFFFKPLNSYGSKSVYNGKSISRKNFERLFETDTIVQETIPPDKIEDWKYDVRVYCYKDQIQLFTARSYQGQLTNFKTLGGGFSTVFFQ